MNKSYTNKIGRILYDIAYESTGNQITTLRKKKVVTDLWFFIGKQTREDLNLYGIILFRRFSLWFGFVKNAR